MVLGEGIDQPPDHSLVLCAMFARFPLEELDASFAERDSYFDTFVPKDESSGRGREVRNYSQLTDGLVAVFYFLDHRFACSRREITEHLDGQF
ncbi:MAG TPA: hypothetical protein VJ746_12245 [Nitrospira sp.]|nr:hypothetical protein [Nitrospira sp.]